MVDVKRVYDEIGKQDGYTVLVDRLWPRGIKKSDLHCDAWLKALAPSSELRKALHRETIDFARFEQQYRDELKQNEALSALKKQMEKQKVTLLTATRLDRQSHITVLKKLLD